MQASCLIGHLLPRLHRGHEDGFGAILVPLPAVRSRHNVAIIVTTAAELRLMWRAHLS